jgi:hypothetical protein
LAILLFFQHDRSQVWHFLPTMSAEPIHFIMTGMAQKLVRAARALIHGFLTNFKVVDSAQKNVSRLFNSLLKLK